MSEESPEAHANIRMYKARKGHTLNALWERRKIQFAKEADESWIDPTTLPKRNPNSELLPTKVRNAKGNKRLLTLIDHNISRRPHIQFQPYASNNPYDSRWRIEIERRNEEQAQLRSYLNDLMGNGYVVAERDAGSVTPRNYRREADPKMYTRKALGMRDDLRRSVRIRDSIRRWWNSIPHPGGRITKETYMMYNTTILKELLPSAYESQGTEVIEQDWEFDSEGQGQFLTEAQFNNSTFDFVDCWVESADEDDYVKFLDRFHHLALVPLFKEYNDAQAALSARSTPRSARGDQREGSAGRARRSDGKARLPPSRATSEGDIVLAAGGRSIGKSSDIIASVFGRTDEEGEEDSQVPFYGAASASNLGLKESFVSVGADEARSLRAAKTGGRLIEGLSAFAGATTSASKPPRSAKVSGSVRFATGEPGNSDQQAPRLPSLGTAPHGTRSTA